MANLTNQGNANLGSLQQLKTFTVDSNNSFYSTALAPTLIDSVSASGDAITYTLTNSPDLSEIIEGSVAIIRGLGDNANNGVKVITGVDDGNDTITVNNLGTDGVTDASPQKYATLEVQGLKTVGMQVYQDLTVTSIEKEDNYGGDTPTADYISPGSYTGKYTKVEVSAGVAELAISSERKTHDQ